jgi:hypothetical protein
MPSTYSTSLGLELIGNGEQAGTWGTTTNTNLGTLLEQAIAGVQSITLPGGDYTLTDFNGLPDEARNAVLVLGGLLGAPCNVIAPAVEKVYIVRNFSNATVTIKTAGGNGVALTNAASAVVFCDGTNFYSATTLNYIDGNLTVTGTTNLQGAVTANSTLSVGGTTTLRADVFCNSNTGQIYLPSGSTASRNNAAPVNGLIRYNSTGNFFEGYANSAWIKFVVQNQAGYTIDYLVVAGGGGSGGLQGGGGAGGAGQVISSSTFVIQGSTTFNVFIGGGGAGGNNGTAGTASSITGVANASTGGGGGTVSPDQNAGGNGGASGNGFAGASGTSGDPHISGGGGGAAAAASGNGGGIGVNTTIRGTSEYFGGGGGGTPGGGGGLGGGGTGAGAGAGTAGGVNTGGGGGGGNNNGVNNGGSGVVILKFETAYYSGVITGSPTVTTSGANTILTFTGSGTYQV